MIGTEFLKGSGLGNQLFCYISARCIALEHGYEFGTASQQEFANNIHSNQGMYFMDVDLGKEITPEMQKYLKRYDEKEDRVFIGNATHDMTHGCYISGSDEHLLKSIEDDTIIYGNLQSEDYFGKYKNEIKSWLKVKPEFESDEYTRDNLCIINMRGGEYASEPELYLDRRYWLNAIKAMKKIRPDMEFMIVTEDVAAAHKVLPEYEAHHFDMGKDYVTIKNARYLILSNSSFAVIPALTSDTVQYVIAPKYWARHNVSDGYWSSEQNIYSFFNYMDKHGHIFSADECKKELEEYKKKSALFKRLNKKPEGISKTLQILRIKLIYADYMFKKIVRKIERETGVIHEYKGL